MRLILVLLAVLLLLSGCMTYRGVVISPDGKRYQVEQSRPGKISVEDKEIKIEANTQAESRIDKLIDLMILKQLKTSD